MGGKFKKQVVSIEQPAVMSMIYIPHRDEKTLTLHVKGF